jgi:anion-transporting  ArsA/GET3 family ATPase
MTMQTEESLREYLRLNLRVPFVGRIGPVARAFDFIATAAPGVKEVLTVGKICWEVRESIAGRAPWDLVIVDAAATGHIVAQLDAPRAIDELVQVGPVREQTRWMLDLLDDPAISTMLIATTAEEMPVSETRQLVSDVKEKLRIDIGGILVNRVLPEVFLRDDEAVFAALKRPEVAQVLSDGIGTDPQALLSTTQLAVDLRASRGTHLDELRRDVDVPLFFIPELFTRLQGRRVTHRIADVLAEEFGIEQ